MLKTLENLDPCSFVPAVKFLMQLALFEHSVPLSPLDDHHFPLLKRPQLGGIPYSQTHPKYHIKLVIEGSLEVKHPTIWTDEKQRWEESEKRRAEERRSEKRKSQKKEGPDNYTIFEGSLEVKLPTIWTVEKQR